ncbi:MAG: DUF1854 domain-containing protein [Planctomycetia bacterium]|nr:DUF1854 domain-containing protein [Planctomycetia bacterium]
MNTHANPLATITGDSPEGWRLERHAHGRLDLIDAEGRRHADVDVLRAFPVTASAGPVAVVAADGGELAWVESLAALPAALKALLDRELAQREFLPVIERIETVSDTEPTEWAVHTDRGPHRFTVAHADDVARQPDGSVFITDTFGTRYRIPRVAALDSHSRRLLETLA